MEFLTQIPALGVTRQCGGQQGTVPMFQSTHPHLSIDDCNVHIKVVY